MKGKPAPHLMGWWWLLTVVALLSVAYYGFWLMNMRPREALSAWSPADAADRILDEFCRKVNDEDPAALDLLGPAPVFDDEPISEKEADARQAAFYLRQPGFRVMGLRHGEPGNKRKKGDPARAVYTLVTKVQGSTPLLTVRNDRGVVESPSRLFMFNPDLVVEVKDGKIHGVRPELHTEN